MSKEIQGMSNHKLPDKNISVTSGGIKIAAAGKPVDINFEQKKGTVFLLLDCSSSMSGYKLDQARQGILRFANDAIQKNYQVGLIKFDSRASLVCKPNKELSQLEKNLNKLKATGSTNMVDAISMAHEYLNKYAAPLAMVVATDGIPNKVEASLLAGNKAKQDGIEIITIGTADADRNFLSKLASKSHLSSVVEQENFAKAIASSALLLSDPGKKS